MMPATGRLSFLYAALFFELGVNLPFFPLWLHAQALKDDAIGIVLAAPLLVRIAANPIVAAFADRTGHTAATLIACASFVVIGTASLFFTSSFLTILPVVIMIALAQGPVIALADTLALQFLKGEQEAELRYGRIRLWGSASFALANVTAGWMLDWLPPSSIIGMLLVSAAITALAASVVAPRMARPAQVKAVCGRKLAHPWLLGFTIAGAALIQASHAAMYAFSVLHWKDKGLSGGAIGALWSVGVVSEIVVFGVIGHLAFGRRGAVALLVSGASFATIRWIGMAADPDTLTLLALQMMHGATFGATHLGSIFLLARLAPPSMQAQSQAWLAAAWAGLMAGLTTLSGYLYGAWGEQIYWVMAMSAGIGLFLLCVVAVERKRY